ncbi:MAG TPA: nucleotidyltransferase domain-containing protein [Candidatus Lokiarchaeia archaeon]
MKKLISLNKIKKDLGFCSQYWTVLYGSYITGKFILNRSDIDAAIITQTNDRKVNIEIWRNLLEKSSNNYDLKVFELLPLYLQIEIVQSYMVLFGNPLELSEYFYHYRKLWKDMEWRIKNNQFQNIQEKIDAIERQKDIMKI